VRQFAAFRAASVPGHSSTMKVCALAVSGLAGLAAASALALCALPATGCVQVKPWQHELLASPAMNPALLDTELSATYRAKAMESKTAGGLPGTAPGGGCGCTQ